MDEIEKRLRETADTCLECYKGWRGKEKDSKIREDLQEAVHELRKVASRLEIEMAVSERGEMSEKPLPIPPHRSSHKPRGNGGGNNGGNSGAGKPARSKPRKPDSKQAE